MFVVSTNTEDEKFLPSFFYFNILGNFKFVLKTGVKSNFWHFTFGVFSIICNKLERKKQMKESQPTKLCN